MKGTSNWVKVKFEIFGPKKAKIPKIHKIKSQEPDTFSGRTRGPLFRRTSNLIDLDEGVAQKQVIVSFKVGLSF